MPQISFTPRNSDVYDRFSRLLLEEQLKRGKLTAPQFLDLVLDAFEGRHELKAMQDIENGLDLIVLKGKGEDSRYVSNVTIAAANIYFTSHKSEAMVFDSKFQAKAFLREHGRLESDWILEPVNETK